MNFTSDLLLLSAMMADRAAWELVRPHLTSAELGPQAEAWLPMIDGWYRSDGNATAVLPEMIKAQAGKLPADHREGLVEWFESIPHCPSGLNVVSTVLDLKRQNAARELAGALLQGKDASELVARYSELQQAVNLTDANGVADGHWAEADIHKLIEQSEQKNLVPVYPKALRAACNGGVEPGDHIVVFARPEMGKTLFSLNMTHGWLRSGRRVLYIGNEDRIDKLKRRLVGAMANFTPSEMRQYWRETEKRAKKAGIDNAFMWWQRHMAVQEIEKKIRETKPNCVVFDQIRGLHSKADGMTKKLQEIASEVRYLLGKYELVGLSTNQGNDRTERHGQEPPPWLTMGDVADSRTDLPGQADLLLGLGADKEMRDRNERACSILKNKGEGSHEGFRFWIDPLRTRIR